MKYKYRVRYTSIINYNIVEKLEVIKETEHMITYLYTGVSGNMNKATERKRSSDVEWFATEKEAYRALIEQTKEHIEELRKKIVTKHENLRIFKKKLLLSREGE